MSNSAHPLVFRVRGEDQAIARGAPAASALRPLGLSFSQGRVKQSVRVAAQRSAATDVRVAAIPGEDIVVLHIAGGPALALHPEHARDLMLAQAQSPRGRSAADAAATAPTEVVVPAQLQWRGLEQGLPAPRGATHGVLGSVLLQAIEVVTGLGKGAAADIVASAVARAVDDQVDAGVYVLGADALPNLKAERSPVERIDASGDGAPLLVLVHGAFVHTQIAFGKLWIEHPQRVRSLFTQYGGRVYALDHPTLRASPVENALTLARALPAGARLHLLTHSRGGLVAEVLARVCGSPSLSAVDFDCFPGEACLGERSALSALAEIVRERRIQVERVVRVGCPARGTLLASKRLDAYLSVFRWALELARIPVAPVLVDFLGEVARRRADPELIPGLAALMPDSPLVKWLHASDAPLPGDLRVIAGDIQGDSVSTWVKTLLADAYYWTDNDLVVQTRSMYGGAARAGGASFVFERGSKVTHFNYFGNEATAAASVNALLHDTPPGFRAIGPLSWSGQSATGLRALRGGADDPRASDKPAVVVLPGILGSNLRADGSRIWLAARFLSNLKRLAYRPGVPDGVEPDGPIERVYDEIEAWLARTHEVIEFAFDWRRPLEEEARRLATVVEAALALREASGKPVRMLAHSMGGLLARTFQLERPDVWERMMAHPGARLLMLGTPNAGSWAPMQVLSGDDTFGNMLVSAGAPLSDRAARELMAAFPGFIQLQAALRDPEHALHRSETWRALAEEDLARVREYNFWHSDERQLLPYSWGVPPQEVLDRAVELRRRLDRQRDRDLPAFSDKLVLVVGAAAFTPDGYERGPAGVVYLNVTGSGDGRVTLASAQLPGVRTWQVECEHGALPAHTRAFEAFLELLETGTTDRLPRVAHVASRSREATPERVHTRSRPSRSRAVDHPPVAPRDVLSFADEGDTAVGKAAESALAVTVLNGDLMFVHWPLLLGHYRTTRLSGTEKVMDDLIGGAMGEALAMGQYPDGPGTHQVFVNTRTDPANPWRLPRPEAVIVVGLGEEGKLRASDLQHSVKKGVIAWAQRIVERTDSVPAFFELAATLVGSGGIGVHVAEAAQAIVRGVREANTVLAERRWPCVGHLHLIDLFLDRATEAWRALEVEAAAQPGQYLLTETIRKGIGALARPIDAGYRGADYDFIRAHTREAAGRDEREIVYTLDTRRARTEVSAHATQGRLLRELLTAAASDRDDDPQIGSTLFQLVIPLEIRAFFGGSSEIQLELDRGTAAIPWELLDTRPEAHGSSELRPWAIRAKLLRKLQTAAFRGVVADATADASALVIGEPQCDYARLPGARLEARTVAGLLGGDSALGANRVVALVSPDEPERAGPDARTVINALLEREWRIVHVAGHGDPVHDGKSGGVVLSNGTFLGPREIESMAMVPELVFVNCCHLAALDTGSLLRTDRERPPSRAEFAASVAEALIAIGVRCVIAAGWAVDDEGAKVFAESFYAALLRGRRFIDSVAEAREAAWKLGGNTWAAYQCYGDPEWTLRREGSDAQRPAQPLAEEFAAVASAAALGLALETLAVRSTSTQAGIRGQHDFGRDLKAERGKVRYLEARFAETWGHEGAVAEAFARAYASTGDSSAAISWYEKALAANDGTATLKASEQLANLRVRTAAERVDEVLECRDRAAQRLSELEREDSSVDARSQHERAMPAAETEVVTAAREARKDIAEAIASLENLASVQPTMERASLCGSAYKRLAIIEAAVGRAKDEMDAINNMKLHYAQAEALGRAAASAEVFYPAMNRIAAELALHAGGKGGAVLDQEALALVRQSLAEKARKDPDFWSVVGQTELGLYEALAQGDLAARRESLEREYDDVHARVSAAWLWRSVYDTARFVLAKYARRTAGAEKNAARALLAKLEHMAGEKPLAAGAARPLLEIRTTAARPAPSHRDA